jgi:hypothetical protein
METKRQRSEDAIQRQIPHSLFLSTTVPHLNKQISDFLHFTVMQALEKKETLCQNKNLTSVQIEIEAKLGSLVSKQTLKRLDLPVMSETILNEQMITFNFVSNMTMRQHSQFNQLLNHHTTKNSKLKYTHTRIVDEFIHVPQLGKCRRSIDQETNQTLYMITKTKVADLNIFVPNSPFDCRITVNLESTVKPGFEEEVSLERKKDRLCYKMFPFEVDLTQVRSNIVF